MLFSSWNSVSVSVTLHFLASSDGAIGKSHRWLRDARKVAAHVPVRTLQIGAASLLPRLPLGARDYECIHWTVSQPEYTRHHGGTACYSEVAATQHHNGVARLHMQHALSFALYTDACIAMANMIRAAVNMCLQHAYDVGPAGQTITISLHTAQLHPLDWLAIDTSVINNICLLMYVIMIL